MANRVRFLSLVLAGFGRYDRPTRFSLAGRSCTFTSANELGKSTFQAGLLATLFGPPSVRAKAAAFQSRHRSWNGPIAFFGELELTVNDEAWRIRQDFDALETKVWRLGPGGAVDLRLHVKAKSSRGSIDSEPYARLLQDWLGISDMSFYEAMFTVSQESTLATSWQIDPRIASLVYGPTVERLNGSLLDLFARFRDISRNTREFQITVGSQGERNGRSDGRLDQVLVRIESLQTNLAAARDRTALVAAHRVRVQQISESLDQLRSDANQVTKSLQAWRDWNELESRLRPAVDSYERLRSLNERCQVLTRPLADLRHRLLVEFRVFEQAPGDLTERLEYHPLLEQSLNEAQQRYSAAIDQSTKLRDELARIENAYVDEFANIEYRDDLPEQVEELRLVQEELARTRAHLNELTSPDDTTDSERLSMQARQRELEPWRPCLSEEETQSLRLWAEAFCTQHAEFESGQEAIRLESAWLEQQEALLRSLERDRAELSRSRRQEADNLASKATGLRSTAERAKEASRELARVRKVLASRYVDFAGAPHNLIDLWEQLHITDALRGAQQGEISAISRLLRNSELRSLWRRGLTAAGVLIAVLCVVLSFHWTGWVAALPAVALVGALRWIYPLDAANYAELRRVRNRHEAELLRINKQRDQLIAELGSFVVPAEREAEWRRLWPPYRRELDRLDSTERAIPKPAQVADWIQLARETETKLERHNHETATMLGELDDAQRRAHAEYARRKQALSLIVDQAHANLESYFGDSQGWQSVGVQVLGKEWQPLLTLARADMPDVQYAPQLVRWCQSLDDHSWSRFHNAWNELNQLDTQLASDPAAEAKRAENIQQAREVLSSLEQDEQRLITAIAPFTAATDPTWLEDRLAASRDAQAQIAELARQLQSLPDIDLLAKQLEQAEHELARSSDALAPLLTQFGQDVSRIFEAMAERDQLFDQAARLQSDAAALLVESGFNSLEELAHEAGKAEGLVGTIREESQQLIARAPELWQAVDAPSELVTQQLEELETRNRALQTTIDAAERERAELVAAIRQLEADPSSDAASIETELALLRDEKAELERTRDAIAAEFQEANRLLRELEQVERTALEGRITAYFADFSRTPGRRVELNEDLQVHVRNEDGVRYQPSQLSHGARDQLYLAVYLATTAGLDLPFILDDPFVNCDSERLQAIRACWDRLAPDHQLILLSHSPELAGWAPSLEMREAA
jgi:uncharacterized protein YhaN